VQPGRWSLAVNIAYLLARLGEEQARRMLAEVLPEIERSGKRLTESDSRTILAEIALARNDVGEAERQAAIVEKLDPPDDWLGQSRLRVVRIVIALTRGDTARARSERAQLHDAARERGDIMTELLTHSLADGARDELCCKDRHAKLLAQTGMRGVTAEWMMPASLRPSGIPVPP
jgi:ATP/maltotriose-dependent transcriptional regulator MalT